MRGRRRGRVGGSCHLPFQLPFALHSQVFGWLARHKERFTLPPSHLDADAVGDEGVHARLVLLDTDLALGQQGTGAAHLGGLREGANAGGGVGRELELRGSKGGGQGGRGAGQVSKQMLVVG